MNIDALVYEHMGGGGGVFRTSCGFVKCSFIIPLHGLQAFEVELLIAIYAIELAKQFNNDVIFLESNSVYVVNLFQYR